MVWQSGRGAGAKRCAECPGPGDPIDKDALQAGNGCTGLSEARFNLPPVCREVFGKDGNGGGQEVRRRHPRPREVGSAVAAVCSGVDSCHMAELDHFI